MYAPELLQDRVREVRAEVRRSAAPHRPTGALRAQLRRLRDRF